MDRSDHLLETASLIRLHPDDNSNPAATARLVVVILDIEEEAALAGRILTLAQPDRLRVLLLGISSDSARVTELRRKLVTISAFVRDESRFASANSQETKRSLNIEIRLVHGNSWIAKIKDILQPTDRLACYSEQNIGSRGKSLSDVLSSNFKMPIYVFSGLSASRPPRRDILLQSASWLAPILSIIGFLLLQIRIAGTMQGWAQTALLLLTVFAETCLIWICNSLFA
jgi:hypothetical protein